MIASLSDLEVHLQKLRHWHATKTFEGSWSCLQLHRDPTTTPGYGTGNDDEEKDINGPVNTKSIKEKTCYSQCV